MHAQSETPSPEKLLRRWVWLFLGCLLDGIVFMAIGLAMVFFMPQHGTAAFWLTTVGGTGACACAGGAIYCLNKLAARTSSRRGNRFLLLGNNLAGRLLVGVQFATLSLVLLTVTAHLLSFHMAGFHL